MGWTGRSYEKTNWQ